MPRTVEEIETVALALKKGSADDGARVATMVIQIAEAKVLCDRHRANRVALGKIAPDMNYLIKKLKSGKVKIHGVAIRLEE